MSAPLSEFLRERRTDAGLSRKSLAEKARASAPAVTGLHQTSIERWEAGWASPSAPQAEALFRALGLSDEERAEALRLSAGPTPTGAS